jgi:REP element-mobilizing transposase RayT
MSYNPDIHDRQSMRHPQWDYRRPAAYFITVCTHQRRPVFGTIANETMRLNACGRIASEEWHRTEQVRANVTLDAFVVMPNHIHGIIWIHPDGGDSSARRDSSAMNPYAETFPHPGNTPTPDHNRSYGRAVANSISTMMRQFKSIATKRINRHRDTPGATVWQRNFYDHIIRNRQALHRIRRYIHTNPARWAQDRFHSHR